MIKLQSIILPSTKDCTEERMYFRKNDKVKYSLADDCITIKKNGILGFDTYFNAFFQVWPFIFSRSYPSVIHRFSYLCRTKQKLMVQIDDVIVSLDVFREKFLCDLHACKGECCIESYECSRI